MTVDAFYQGFGLHLRSLRKRADLTQEQLASRLGLNRTTVVNIEKGRQRVALHQLIELADALGCEPAELLPMPDARVSAEVADKFSDEQVAEFVSRVKSKGQGRR